MGLLLIIVVNKAFILKKYSVQVVLQKVVIFEESPN